MICAAEGWLASTRLHCDSNHRRMSQGIGSVTHVNCHRSGRQLSGMRDRTEPSPSLRSPALMRIVPSPWEKLCLMPLRSREKPRPASFHASPDDCRRLKRLSPLASVLMKRPPMTKDAPQHVTISHCACNASQTNTDAPELVTISTLFVMMGMQRCTCNDASIGDVGRNRDDLYAHIGVVNVAQLSNGFGPHSFAISSIV
jgi:hypothetical protein